MTHTHGCACGACRKCAACNESTHLQNVTSDIVDEVIKEFIDGLLCFHMHVPALASMFGISATLTDCTTRANDTFNTIQALGSQCSSNLGN